GDLKHLQQHMPGQTSSEEATGVHMKQQQKKQQWKRKSECAAGRMMREADTCPCSSWLRSLSCCPIRKTRKKTRKPKKKTRNPSKNSRWNILNCWDIFNIF
ncbi:hypothetical protein EGK_17159, partial [Macaca mulatta]